jgi:autophagy-related protein 5
LLDPVQHVDIWRALRAATPPSAFAGAPSTPAATTLFRRLTWEGTVPVEVRVDAKELPANSNRGLECYYLQAPRVSYLPLLVPEIKRLLTDVVFDDEGARALREEDWWFEAEDGGLLKWCVRVRLLPAYMLRCAQALADWAHL